MAACLLGGAVGDSPVAAAAAVTAGSCHGPGNFGAPFLGSNWPGGFRGVPVYSNGVSGSFTNCLHTTRTPSGHVVVDGYEWQCVELVDRLYLEKGWIHSAWLGNGNQLYQTAPAGLAREAQGHVTSVQPGDVISFAGPNASSAGHAAVVSQVQGSYLTIVNQNTDRTNLLSHAYLTGGRISMVGWAGWRPIGVVDAPQRPASTLRIAGAPSGAAVNAGYVASLSTRGGSGPTHWGVSAGSVPAGLSLARNGHLTGVALATGTYGFTATARDARGQAASARLRVKVDPGRNLVRDGGFSRPSPWRLLGGARHGVVRARSLTAARAHGVPAGSHELAFASSTPGGSLYEDIPVAPLAGTSYSFSVWARSASSSSRTVCVVLWGLEAGDRGATCRTIGRSWVHLTAPYDVESGRVRSLRAQVYLENGKDEAVDLAGATLLGNALKHASFAHRIARGWSLLPATRAGQVNGQAYTGSGLPVGSTYFQLNTTAPGGSVYQDVSGHLPAGQHFRLNSWVRANGGSGRARVCLTLWGLGRHVSAGSTCRKVGRKWVHLSVAYRVPAAGETGLRSQLYVDRPHQNVDLTGTQLRNTE